MGSLGGDEYVDDGSAVGRSAVEPERPDDHTGEHQKGSPAACYKFNLRDDQAHRVEGLGLHQLQAIVANCGQESLFQLRDDFWQLLDAPPVSRVPWPRCTNPRLGPRSPDPGRCPDASRLDP